MTEVERTAVALACASVAVHCGAPAPWPARRNVTPPSQTTVHRRPSAASQGERAAEAHTNSPSLLVLDPAIPSMLCEVRYRSPEHGDTESQRYLLTEGRPMQDGPFGDFHVTVDYSPATVITRELLHVSVRVAATGDTLFERTYEHWLNSAHARHPHDEPGVTGWIDVDDPTRHGRLRMWCTAR